MLPAMHPVDIEIVGDDEQRYLEPERPLREHLEPRETADRVESRDDDREDDNAEDVVLRDRVQSKVVEKPLSKEPLTFGVRDDPLEQGKEDSARADRRERETFHNRHVREHIAHHHGDRMACHFTRLAVAPVLEVFRKTGSTGDPRSAWRTQPASTACLSTTRAS